MNKQQIIIAMAQAIAEAIRSLGSVPSGHLYAQLMGKLELEEFNAIISVLVKSGLITNNNNKLVWIKSE